MKWTSFSGNPLFFGIGIKLQAFTVAYFAFSQVLMTTRLKGLMVFL